MLRSSGGQWSVRRCAARYSLLSGVLVVVLRRSRSQLTKSLRAPDTIAKANRRASPMTASAPIP